MSFDISYLPKNHIDLYESFCNSSDNEETIIKEFLSAEYYDEVDISLPNIVEIFLQYREKITDEEMLETIKSKKKEYKKYLFEQVKKEYNDPNIKKGNPLYLKKDCQSYSDVLSTGDGAGIEGITSIDEYREFRYKHVYDWYSNAETYCIDFEYFNKLRTIPKIRGLVHDIKYFTVKYVIESETVEEQKNLPEYVFGSPLFSFKQEEMQLKAKEEDGNAIIYSDYQQGNTQIQTIVESTKITDSTTLSMLEDAYSNNTTLALDTSDIEVLACICSSITGENVATGTLVLPFNQLYKDYFGESYRYRKENYIKLKDKIETLAKYTLDISRYDRETGMVERSLLHFFDVTITSPTEGDYDLIGASDDIIYKDAEVKIKLGDSILSAWQQNKIMSVRSRDYEELIGSKAKAFLFFLEKKRLTAYPETDDSISFSEIKNSLRFGKAPRFRKDLTALLDQFKIKGLIIEDFDLVSKAVNVKYKPYTEREKATYELK